MSEKLEVGSIVSAKVVRIKPFGAIVVLSNKALGLVHISQISDSFVENIDDFVAVGDEITVKILSIDEANRKISLSIREATKAQAGNSEPEAVQPRPERAETPSSILNRERGPSSDFDDKMKLWTKQSNERLAGINKRNNRR